MPSTRTTSSSEGAGEVLWTPPADARETTRVGRYLAWLTEHRGLSFAGYEDLWAWSVDDLEGFWSSVWEFFEVRAATPPERVLAGRQMPGARWFPGATLNYGEHLLAGAVGSGDTPGPPGGPDAMAIRARSHTRPPAD